MDDTTYTPGPWTINIDHSTNEPEFIRAMIDDEMWDIASLLVDETGQAMANAKLIAAAPDMLAALQALQLIAQETTKDIVGFDGAEALDDAIDKARAAIDKATK